MQYEVQPVHGGGEGTRFVVVGRSAPYASQSSAQDLADRLNAGAEANAARAETWKKDSEAVRRWAEQFPFVVCATRGDGAEVSFACFARQKWAEDFADMGRMFTPGALGESIAVKDILAKKRASGGVAGAAAPASA
jgi:hypothetical protein